MNLIKNQLVILLALIIGCFFCSPVMSAQPHYNKIVFFGDSLTDNGNLYNRSFSYMPKSPPYYLGRFSNGKIWADILAEHYKQDNIDSVNYAMGGQSVKLHNPFAGNLPYTLSLAITNYLWRELFTDRSHSLYIFWIGANDYLYATEDPEQLTTDVVTNIKENVEKLIGRGGRNFLLMNLPDLTKAPIYYSGQATANLATLTSLHNRKLETAARELQLAHPDVTIRVIDLFQECNLVVNNIAFYNEKYNTHFTNLTESCWTGGYSRKRSLQMQQQDLVAKIKKDRQAQPTGRNLQAENNLTPEQLATFILNSPDLAAAYEVGEGVGDGAVECKDPDSYLFWDKVHPTAAAHKIFGNAVIKFIDQNFIPG
jgi:phospholipase/lecithinase/hemolysin